MAVKKIIRLFGVVFALMFCAYPSVQGQTTNHQVYSLFVMNIAKYSAWPTYGSEFKIVVFGKSKIYDELQKLSAAKLVNGVPLKVSQTDNLSDLGSQQIIYLPDGKSSMLDDILKLIHGKPIMIIAEREGLIKKGAGFSFILLDNNTLRFDINNTDLDKRQIKVSKNLTALANSIL
jgi:YfiR/HmsC-like